MPTTAIQAAIRVPSALRSYVDDQREVTLTADTAGAALHALVEAYPRLKPHLLAEDGRLRAFVNLYVGEDDIRYRDGLDTPLTDGDTLSIIPSIAGG